MAMTMVMPEGPDAKRRKVEPTGAEIVPALRSELVPLPGSANRKSGLLAPTMLLTGHTAEVFSCEFSPDGLHLASGSFDKHIQVWNTYGECDNFCDLKGHTNAVLELHWSNDGHQIYSCSADNSLGIFDVIAGKRVKKLSGHSAIVNSMATTRRGQPMLVSGGDDGTTKLWDLRIRRCVHTWEHPYQMLSVTFDDSGQRVFAGSLDNNVYCYDIRAKEEEAMFTLEGHTDNITGLDVSHDGNFLLSNSMDNSVRLWDVRPFFSGNDSERCQQVMQGATHNFEKNLIKVRWSPDDKYACAGSADRHVYIWSMADRKLLYKLPGHNGSVNEVCFHPKEPIVASASSDKTLFVGELGD